MMTVADKLMKFCSYQERSCLEVRRKMAQLKVTGEEAEKLLSDLQEMNFVSDDRFAECFVRGKMNAKRWGRVKLKIELQKHGVANSLIDSKLSEIDEEQYLSNLRYMADKWHRENRTGEKPQMVRFLYSKGYAMSEISKVLSDYQFVTDADCEQDF